MQWVVDCKSVGTGAIAVIHLGRYLHRGVIGENDILACTGGQVNFSYRDGKTGMTERRTVSGVDFLWLVLQHVLPEGFRRARDLTLVVARSNLSRRVAMREIMVILRWDRRDVPESAAPIAIGHFRRTSSNHAGERAWPELAVGPTALRAAMIRREGVSLQHPLIPGSYLHRERRFRVFPGVHPGGHKMA